MSEQENVARDLRADGTKMTITAVVNGNYDPEEQDFTGSTTTEHEVYGLLKAFSMATIAGALANNGIVAGDMQATIEAGVVEPLVGWSISTPIGQFTVKSVNKVAPQGEVLAYKLHLAN